LNGIITYDRFCYLLFENLFDSTKFVTESFYTISTEKTPLNILANNKEKKNKEKE